MWLYGFFVNTCFLSSGTTPGGVCTANAIQREMFVTSCQTILIKVVLRPVARDVKLRIRHFHIYIERYCPICCDSEGSKKGKFRVILPLFACVFICRLPRSVIRWSLFCA